MDGRALGRFFYRGDLEEEKFLIDAKEFREFRVKYPWMDNL